MFTKPLVSYRRNNNCIVYRVVYLYFQELDVHYQNNNLGRLHLLSDVFKQTIENKVSGH